jgi:hypothetical protein
MQPQKRIRKEGALSPYHETHRRMPELDIVDRRPEEKFPQASTRKEAGVKGRSSITSQTKSKTRTEEDQAQHEQPPEVKSGRYSRIGILRVPFGAANSLHTDADWTRDVVLV